MTNYHLPKHLFFILLAVIIGVWGCCSVEDTPSNNNEAKETSANYTVMHYQQNANDDKYTAVENDTETLTGTVGSETTAAAKSYAGFTAQKFEQEKIVADGSTTVKIYYDRKMVTLTLNCDNDTDPQTVTGKFGADVKVDIPTKTGYTFAAWNPELPATFPAEDAQYTAKWVKEGDYIITYKNTENAVNDNPAGYNVETETITLKPAVKSGYIFDGWYKEDSFATKVTEIAKGSTGNITLYAKWNLETYSIAYELNGGTNADGNPENYNVETETITLKAATKVGYVFDGWYKEDSFETKVTEIAKGSTGNITLYAKWSLETYTITYELNGGTNADENPESYNVETETITLKVATRVGYVFDGWYKEDSFTTKVTEVTKGSTGNITLYAKWSLETYTIAYELNGGTNADENPENYNVETETITLKAATKVGYVFDGWYEEDSFTTKVTVITTGSTGNITLYAKWWNSEGFVFVEGATITGKIADSKVFIDGRTVTISNFYICNHEVTRGEYKAVMGSDPSTAKAYDKDGNELTDDDVKNNPVNYISWYDALVYCNTLSIKEKLTPCYTIDGKTDPSKWGTVPASNDGTWNDAECDFTANGYRLPTEAEWEYAARGGENYTYAGSDTIDDVAWYTKNTKGTRDVKTKNKNGYGLYDMSGNVWEWCWDKYGDISSDTLSTGSASGTFRCERGGSWSRDASKAQVAFRSFCGPSDRVNNYGFRVVRTAE